MPSPLSDVITSFVCEEFQGHARNSQFRRPLDDENFVTASPFVEQNSESRAKGFVADYMKEVFAGQPANPNRAAIVAMLSAGFSRKAYRRDGSIVDYSELEKRIEEAVENYNEIALVGDKGTGKTVLINNWLNNRTVPFFEEKLHTSWFRIDAAKVYDILDEKASGGRLGDTTSKNPDPKNNTVSLYFMIHSAYVFMEYSGAICNPYAMKEGAIIHTFSPLFQSILKFIRSNDALSSKFAKCLANVEKYYKSLQNLHIRMKRAPSESAVKELFKQHNLPYRTAFLEVFDLFVTACESLELSVMAIIDGIDNVSWDLRNEKYKQMCNEVIHFVDNIDDICRVGRNWIFLVARRETIPELTRPYNSTIDARGAATKRRIDYHYLEMPHSDEQLIISKKLEFATVVDSFNGYRANCVARINSARGGVSGSDFLTREVLKYAENKDMFVLKICEEVNAIISESIFSHNKASPFSTGFYLESLSGDEFMTTLFANNIRDLVSCFRAVREGQISAERQQVKGWDRADRIPEYLLLAGQMILNSRPTSQRIASRASSAPLGSVFPNIFWYNVNDAINADAVWHGLSGLRILQLAFARTWSAADIAYVLNDVFKYSYAVILEQIETFVAFGLLSVEYNSSEEPFAHSNKLPEDHKVRQYRHLVKTTRKGRLIASMSLKSINYLYFIALDTPMHDWFQRERNGTQFVRFARWPNDNSVVMNFIEAQIPTVTTFIRHINFYNSEEMKALRIEKLPESLKRSFRQQELIPDVFSLPDNWLSTIIETIDKNVNSLVREDRRKYNDFEANMLGSFSIIQATKLS